MESKKSWIVQGYVIGPGQRRFSPPTDIIELPDKLLILIEIAGMQTSDFNIVLQRRQLTINGVRKQPEMQNPAFHQAEINYGEFRIKISLPWPAAEDSVSAAYQDGFLHIELPRQAAKKVRVTDLSAQED